MTIFPFEKVWYGVDLGDLRPVDATYGAEDFERLPPVPKNCMDGSFSYLSNALVAELERSLPAAVDKPFGAHGGGDLFAPDAAWQAKLEGIQASLPEGLKLPPALVKFMSAPAAHRQIPSCTACYFDLPDRALPFHWLGEDGYIFHFYRDQQDCLFWYYYVRRSGESCILTSPMPFIPDYDDAFLEGLGDEWVERQVFYTAANFEEFVYRAWVENVLWFGAEEGTAMDASSQAHCDAYAAHYKK